MALPHQRLQGLARPHPVDLVVLVDRRQEPLRQVDPIEDALLVERPATGHGHHVLVGAAELVQNVAAIAGLLHDLAEQRLLGVFAGIYPTTGQQGLALPGDMHHQNATAAVEGEAIDAGTLQVSPSR